MQSIREDTASWVVFYNRGLCYFIDNELNQVRSCWRGEGMTVFVAGSKGLLHSLGKHTRRAESTACGQAARPCLLAKARFPTRSAIFESCNRDADRSTRRRFITEWVNHYNLV